MAWRRNDYLLNELENKPASEVRKEYTRFRKIFNQHLKAGFGEWYERINYRLEPYPTIKSIEASKGNKADYAIRHFLSEMKNLSLSKGFTRTGRAQLKKDAIETLKARGAKSVNDRNFNEFIKFAQFYKDKTGNKYSTDALTVFDTVLSNKGDLDKMYQNFDHYLSKVEDLDKMRRMPKRKQRDALRQFELEV